MILAEPCFCEDKTKPVNLYHVTYRGDGLRNRNAIVFAESKEEAIQIVDESFEFIAYMHYFECEKIETLTGIVMMDGKIKC